VNSERARNEIVGYLDELDVKATRFEDQRDRAAARQSPRAVAG